MHRDAAARHRIKIAPELISATGVKVLRASRSVLRIMTNGSSSRFAAKLAGTSLLALGTVLGCVGTNVGTGESGADASTGDRPGASEGAAESEDASGGEVTQGGSSGGGSASGSSVGTESTSSTSAATSGDSEDEEVPGTSSATMGDPNETDDGETEAPGDDGLAECRGVVAVRAGSGNYVGWRAKATDPETLAFNVYRDDTLLNAEPLTGAPCVREVAASIGPA